jgi:hypothetical protein
MDIVDTQVHFNQVGTLDAGLAAMAAVGVRYCQKLCIRDRRILGELNG